MQTLSAAQRTFFERAATTYQADLAGDISAQGYLAKRGINAQAAATFRLGVVGHPLPGHEGYWSRLAIPYLTPAGVVNIRYRCLKAHKCADENCPKYLGDEGAGTNLFNVLDLKKDSPFVCIAEGEIDAISLSLAGLPAVGLPGVDAWQKHFSRCLEDFETVYAFGDNDTAGRKLNKLLAREAKARSIRLPEGKDCNDIFRTEGAAGLRKLIE